MTHPRGVLFNDWAFVEVRCHVMRCRTDQLHAALVRTVIGLGPGECRKKGMMNIDDSILVGPLMQESNWIVCFRLQLLEAESLPPRVLKERRCANVRGNRPS